MTTTFSTPALPYASSALSPFLTQSTVENLHDTIQAGVTSSLNTLQGTLQTARNNNSWTGLAANQASLSSLTSAYGLYKNFWLSMKLGGQALNSSSSLKARIDTDFGNLTKLQANLTEAALALTTQGWVTLAWNKDMGALFVVTTIGHDSLGQWGGVPLVTMNLWDAAWQPDHANDRSGYISSFISNIDWVTAATRYSAMSS